MVRDGEKKFKEYPLEKIITKLERKIEALKAECTKEREFNAAALKEYGSELCVAELERNVQKITDRIREQEENIVLLRSFQNCLLLLSETSFEDLFRFSEQRLNEAVAHAEEIKVIAEKNVKERESIHKAFSRLKGVLKEECAEKGGSDRVQ